MKKIIYILLFVLIFSLQQYAVAAEENSRLLNLSHNGTDNYFVFYAEKGITDYLEFEVYNDSEHLITNLILVYDSLTAVNGGNIIMSPDDIATEQTASWFDTNSEEISLLPGERVLKKLEFQIPNDISSGQYTAILALYSDETEDLESKTTGSQELGITVNTHYTSTLAVVINIGEAPDGVVELSNEAYFDIEEKSGRSFLYIPFSNAGNTYEFPEISVSITDKNGDILFSRMKKMDIVYRQTDSAACFETTGFIEKAGEYFITAAAGDEKRINSFSELSCTASISNRDIRKAVINKISEEAQNSSDFESGFFVISKNGLMIFSGSLATIILTLFLLANIKKRI